MNLNFNKNGVAHTPLNKWELSDGSFLVIYQGSRGDNPELDFIIKYDNSKYVSICYPFYDKSDSSKENLNSSTIQIFFRA